MKTYCCMTFVVNIYLAIRWIALQDFLAKIGTWQILILECGLDEILQMCAQEHKNEKKEHFL